MRRERKILTILLLLLALPAIYLTIDPEFNFSQRYLKLSLQNPVDKFQQVKKSIDTMREQSAKSSEASTTLPLTAMERYQKLHREISQNFTRLQKSTGQKWDEVF